MLPAASPGRPARRATARHRRLRRLRRDHGAPRAPGRHHDLEPRLVGLRAARVHVRRLRLRPQGRALGRARAGAAEPVSGLRRALGLVAIEGIVVGLVAVAIVLSSDHVDSKAISAALILFVGWSWIGVGLYAWWRRPDNRFGVLMTAVGFAFFLTSLSAADAHWLFTVGVILSSVYAAVFVHMLLSYPDGRIGAPGIRRLVTAAYAVSVLGPLPSLMLADVERLGCDDCPTPAIFITDDETLYTVFNLLVTVVAVVIVGYVLYVVIQRWQAAAQAQRRAMAPVIWSGVCLLVLLAGSLTSEAVH